MLFRSYLRGSVIETYLEDVGMSNTYCMVISYSEENSKSHLRYRAIPINFNNLSMGRVEKLFRIDVPDKKSSENFCQGSADNISSSSDIVYSASELCPSCLETFNSKSLKIFTSTGSEIGEEVDGDLLNVSALSVRVDPTNSSISNKSECNDTLCSAKGYDCCLNGQCVNDGETKPGALEHDEYFQSKIDIKSNPLNFTKYPEIYYVCANVDRSVDQDSSTTKIGRAHV